MAASDADALDSAATLTTTAITPRSLDDRLTMLAVRMTYTALSFFFASFYFGLVYLQIVNENGLWKPKGIDHPPTWMGVSEVTLVLLAGLVYFGAQWYGVYERRYQWLQIGLWIAALLTVVAAIIHVVELHSPGFSLQGGGYVSLFIAIEGVYTPLLVITTILLIGVANRARLGLFRQSLVGVEGFGEFFGWMCAIALINFLALYVQPFFPIA